MNILLIGVRRSGQPSDRASAHRIALVYYALGTLKYGHVGT